MIVIIAGCHIVLKEALIIKYDYAEVHNNLGFALQSLGKLNEAVKSYENALIINSSYPEAHNNLGNTFKALKQLDNAINCYEKSIAMNPGFAYPYYNIGLIFYEQRELVKAIEFFEIAIAINPNYYEAINSLGAAFQMLGKMNLAAENYHKAIIIKPDFLDSHINLGLLLVELNKLKEAESFLRKAITINPESAKGYNNLGNALKGLGKLKDAELSYRKAIDLKPDFADAYNNLGIIFYANGNIDSSLESLEKACSIDPESKLLLTIIGARKKRANLKHSSGIDNISNARLISNPLVLNREVEKELIDTLYKIKSIELDEVRDPGYGNAKGSNIRNSLFEEDRPIIKTVEKDLVEVIKAAINADIYIEESWFVILGAGGGLKSHNHLTHLDKDPSLNLANQKFSLVYYISPGDQDCTEPGLLRLNDPDDSILPYEGMIMVFPADRNHSVVYNGKKDRVIIGINFYSL